MGHLYHGSSKSGIKKIEPHKSTHGSYVYATELKELAIIFSGRAGDDLTYSLFRNFKDEPWQLVERVPNGFETMFNNSSSIYTVKDTTFKDIKTGFVEVVSDVGVDVLSEEKIENVYQKVEELAEKGIIKIYYYPNKPTCIPQDDSDLIEIEIRQSERKNKEISRRTFERLLLLHPHLLQKVNAIASSKNPNFVPFKIEDLIDIFDQFMILQMIDTSREQFLKSSIISISTLYPKLTAILKEKIKLFDKSKEEKIAHLIDVFSKSVRNIPQNWIDQAKQRYLNDSRPFSEIGKEIIDIYNKINAMEQLINKKLNSNVLNDSIILIGPMGTGKSTISTLLCQALDKPCISLDDRNSLDVLYQQSKNFKYFKDFEFFLTGSVLTNLKEPAIVDFGAGHSVYENPIQFLEMHHLIEQFRNVVLLIPSEDKKESRLILNQRKGIELGSQRDNENCHFIESPCNYQLATMIQYTKNKTPEEITNELLMKISQKSEETNLNIPNR